MERIIIFFYSLGLLLVVCGSIKIVTQLFNCNLCHLLLFKISVLEKYHVFCKNPEFHGLFITFTGHFEV